MVDVVDTGEWVIARVGGSAKSQRFEEDYLLLVRIITLSPYPSRNLESTVVLSSVDPRL